MRRTQWMWLGAGLLLAGLWTGHAVFGALPQSVNTNSPADTDPISQGAKQIRDFKLFTSDVFGIPATPAQVNAAALAIATTGIVNFPTGIGSTTTMVGITGYLIGNGSGTVTGHRVGWASVENTAGTPSSKVAYNVSSYTDGGTGDTTVNFTTAFTNTDKVCVVSQVADTTGWAFVTSMTASAVRVEVRNAGGSNVDGDFTVLCVGAQQ